MISKKLKRYLQQRGYRIQYSISWTEVEEYQTYREWITKVAWADDCRVYVILNEPKYQIYIRYEKLYRYKAAAEHAAERIRRLSK